MPAERASARSPVERPITLAELRSHASYADAWIAINGTVYDITDFIPQHPFGDSFRGHLGTECGGLFSSAHARVGVEERLESEAFRAANGIRLVGQLAIGRERLCGDGPEPLLERLLYRDTHRDAFWQELKSEVGAFLRENDESLHYSTAEGAAHLLYHLAIYLGLSYLAWFEGSVLAAYLLGIHMICALADVAHMATHFGFTRCRPLNFLAAHLFDLSGASGLEWQITHQTHHHQPHSAIDHQTNVYGYIGTRIHGYVEHRPYHRSQPIHFWLTLSLYLPFRIVSTSAWLIMNRQFVRHGYEIVAHVVAKGLLLAQIAYCAYAQGLWTALLVFGAYAVAYSQTAFVLLFNDHEETHRLLSDTAELSGLHRALSWAEVQVRTSNNWYPTNWLGAFIQFHYGYFNHHIEHHLFPTFKPSLLRKISPIVRKLCRKHGLPYLSTPFLDVQRSLQTHIVKMARPDKATPVR